MKRLFLTLFFTAYTIFIPFVVSNCSIKDEPFALGFDPSSSEAEPLVEYCRNMEYTVNSCIEILQQEEERIQQEQSKVSNAVLLVDDFVMCQSQESISEPIEIIDPEATEEDQVITIDCVSTISDMVEAYQICSPLSNAEKYDGCKDVEDTVDSAVNLCDEGSEEVSEDFCSSLTA